MSETSIEMPTGFTELSKSQQVHYLQALWDQISEQPNDIPVREGHLQLAEERLRHYRNNPSTTVSATEVIDRLTKEPK